MRAEATSEPIYCRPARAPEIFGFSRSTLYRLIEKHRIKIHRPSRNISLVRVSDVRKCIEGLGDQLED